MRTPTYLEKLVGVCLALSLPACAASGPEGNKALPAAATMSIELTDLEAPIPGDGNLMFAQLDGVGPEIELQITSGGGNLGFGMNLSRERAGDLVAGRLVEDKGLVAGGPVDATDGRPRDPLGSMTFRIGGTDVVRTVISMRLTMQGDSAVVLTAALGAPDGGGIPDLPPTATLTARGQLRLSCSVQPAPGATGGVRVDAAFSTPYCAGLRTDLGLDGLLGISNSI